LIGADEEGTLAQLKAFRKTLVDPTIAKHRGRIVKTTGDGMLVPRCVFPLSTTCWALTGVPKTSRDMKKDCGKPGCPNDDRSQGFRP